MPENFGELTVFVGGDRMFPRGGDFLVKVRAVGNPSAVLLSGETKGSSGSALSLGTLLKQGKDYVLEAVPICPSVSQSEALAAVATTTLHVGAPSEPPTTLGALKLVRYASATVPIGGGAGCWEDHEAAVADVALDPGALPAAWRALITNYQLMVDGAPFNWPMTSGALGPTDRPAAFYLTGPREFRTWTLCSPGLWFSTPLPIGVSPGQHTLWVRARVPSSPAKLIESEKVEVYVRCPTCTDWGCGPTPQDPAPQGPAPENGGIVDAATSADGAPPAPDTAEPQGDAAAAETEAADESVEESASGCSAAKARPSGNEAWPLLSVLLACIAAFRRARQRPRGRPLR